AGTYFLTFTVVDWVDIFSRRIYRDILLDSLRYCRAEKGLQIWGYALMTNHIHSILRAKAGNLPSIVQSIKRHTASKILKAIQEVPESRQDWMLKRFEFAARKNSRDSFYQFWNHNNHAELIDTHAFFEQKLNYIHQNPVRAGWVEKPEDWLYSSMRNYMGLEAIMEIDVSDW
ncbi:MAG TPA: transposase, partial [Saprospiraceae bacterium]